MQFNMSLILILFFFLFLQNKIINKHNRSNTIYKWQKKKNLKNNEKAVFQHIFLPPCKRRQNIGSETGLAFNRTHIHTQKHEINMNDGRMNM